MDVTCGHLQRNSLPKHVHPGSERSLSTMDYETSKTKNVMGLESTKEVRNFLHQTSANANAILHNFTSHNYAKKRKVHTGKKKKDNLHGQRQPWRTH